MRKNFLFVLFKRLVIPHNFSFIWVDSFSNFRKEWSRGQNFEIFIFYFNFYFSSLSQVTREIARVKRQAGNAAAAAGQS